MFAGFMGQVGGCARSLEFYMAFPTNRRIRRSAFHSLVWRFNRGWFVRSLSDMTKALAGLAFPF